MATIRDLYDLHIAVVAVEAGAVHFLEQTTRANGRFAGRRIHVPFP